MLSSESDTEDDILRIRRICMFYFDGRDARVSFRFAHLKEVIFIFSFFFFLHFVRLSIPLVRAYGVVICF